MDDLIEFDALKTKVLKYIIYKKRTEQEVRTKFKDINESLLDKVIDYLKDTGYINDEDYVKRAVNEFINLRNLSIKEISYKLYSKGLDSKIIENYIDKNIDSLEEYEIQSAKRIYLKKLSQMEEQDIIIFLKKKGYKEKTINYIKENGVNNE